MVDRARSNLLYATTFEDVTGPDLRSLASEIAAAAQGSLESLVYYPHPFVGWGLVAVYRDSTFIPAAVAELRARLPAGTSFHCLRRRELFLLTTPGQFLYILPQTFNEHPHLFYCLRTKGVVLFGADIRNEIPEGPSAEDLLEVHAERCLFYLRNSGILRPLMKRQYRAMIRDLDANLRHVMATALLRFDEWTFTADSVPGAFRRRFEPDLCSIWDSFAEIVSRSAKWDENEGRSEALDAVWLFESFIRGLRKSSR